MTQADFLPLALNRLKDVVRDLTTEMEQSDDYDDLNSIYFDCNAAIEGLQHTAALALNKSEQMYDTRRRA